MDIPACPGKSDGIVSGKWWHILAIIFLVIFTTGLFLYTVKIRSPWFGIVSELNHQWHTSSTVIMTRNWYREGIIKLKFVQVEDPASVEFPALEKRKLYLSYPPGAVLPVYLLAKIIRHEPTVPMVMGYNLANHLLIAIFLALLAYILLAQLKVHPLNAMFFSIVPPMFELLMPGPLYWHQNVYYADEAVILPFAIVIFLEVLRKSIRKKSTLNIVNIIQTIIFFYGFLTDWLFVFIALVMYVKRILTGEIPVRKGILQFLWYSLVFWLPGLIAIGLFLIQVSYFNFWQEVMERATTRMSFDKDMVRNISFTQKVWLYMILNYGQMGLRLLWSSIIVFIIMCGYTIYLRVRKRTLNSGLTRILCVTGLLLVPCFLQIYALRNHSYVHDFSVLKFSLSLAVIPFIIFPVLLVLDYKKTEPVKKNPWIMLMLNIVVLLMAILYITGEYPRYKKCFPEPNPEYQQLGRYFEKRFDYNDIVFSPDFEIPYNPPQAVSHTMKRVYPYTCREDVYEKVRNLREPYRVVILHLDEKWRQKLKKLDELNVR
ncbi:MAG: hypothetical protein J7M18_05105 [Candidatus Eremiobacteraeota bacterium]|nr:hypothetical protein [Candidatus Eremiobacteraeota bacterium]